MSDSLNVPGDTKSNQNVFKSVSRNVSIDSKVMWSLNTGRGHFLLVWKRVLLNND
jgi:hypothetical protein